MNNTNITFIGAGNISRSLIGGLINKNFPPQHIWVSSPTVEKLNTLQKLFGINVTTDNAIAVQKSQVIVLCIKPLQTKQVALEIAPYLVNQDKLIISVVTGVQIADFTKWLGETTAIVRSMPNTAALVGSSATALFANRATSEAQKELAESILRAVGMTVWLAQEKDIDIVTAVSGSGPAYFFYLMEALEIAATQLGLDKHIAHLLTIQTAQGAAHMALQSNLTVEELRAQVTSPGGTTEQAIKLLEQHQFQQLMIQAITAAKDRAVELADLLHQKGENL